MALDSNNIRELAMKTAETLKQYLVDSDGWQVAKKTKDLIVEYKRSNCPGFEHGFLYRGQTEYNCSKETLFKYIVPSEKEDCLRLKWDKDIKSLRLVNQIDSNVRILNSRTNSAAMGLISPRDFVDVVMTLRSEECISTNGVSIEVDECPPVDKYIRGFNHPCGIMCLSVPGKPNSTRLVTFIQPDIKGMLPRSLVDSAIPVSMVGFFNNLRAILLKDGQLQA